MTNDHFNTKTTQRGTFIQKYEGDFEDFGKVRFKMEPLESGQKEKIYLLNEEQATLLMTYLRNSDIVRKFKKNLVSLVSIPFGTELDRTASRTMTI